MKARTFTWTGTLFLILALTLTSCRDDFFDGIDGYGDVVEQTLDLEPFDGFVNAIAANVYLKQGDDQLVEIEGQENIIENIRLEVVNGIWRITYDRWVHFAKPVNIYITLPTLTSAAISGTGSVTGLNRFTGLDQVSLTISGSGTIRLDTESEDLDVLISGSGGFRLNGTTGKLNATITGSGSIDAYGLESEGADILISGSGNAYLLTEDFLDVRITGSGCVFYKGNPEVNASVTGTGRIRHE